MQRTQRTRQLTQEQPFHLSVEKQVTAPLMRQTGNFKYAEFSGLQVLEITYAGDDLSMIVLLPREADGLDHFERIDSTTFDFVGYELAESKIGGVSPGVQDHL